MSAETRHGRKPVLIRLGEEELALLPKADTLAGRSRASGDRYGRRRPRAEEEVERQKRGASLQKITHVFQSLARENGCAERRTVPPSPHDADESSSTWADFLAHFIEVEHAFGQIGGGHSDGSDERPAQCPGSHR